MPAPLTGQVALSASAQQLSQPVAHSAFTIKAPLSNKNPAYIGASTVTSTTGHQLDPGDTLEYERHDQSGQTRYQLSVSDLYAVGTSGDLVTWLASP